MKATRGSCAVHCRTRIAVLALSSVAIATLGALPTRAASLPDASYDGQFTVAGTHETAAVAGALGAANAAVNGTVAIGLKDPLAAGVFYLHGTLKGAKLRLTGANASRVRLRWTGTVSGDTLAGKARIRGPQGRMRGRLTLQRRAVVQPPSGGTPCDPVYFADPVMASVLVPICSHCHGAGGIAQATSFRITPADATATQASTNIQVDVANPSASRLLEKPLALIPHGGGQQIAPGSPEAQVLANWASIVAAGNCGGGPGPVPTTGPELYAANCQSCHGADARGLDGRPSVRCSGAIHDVVVAGKGTGPDAMPAFPQLTDAQIALIQTYLQQLCGEGGRTGADLYAGNCATCHGIDARGTATAPNVRCRKSILAVVRSGRTTVMPAFPANVLADTDVSAILGYLSGLCTADPASQPADLYLSNCASCHGDQAQGGRNAAGIHGSDIQCSSTGDFTDAVRNGEDKMPAFPELSTSDVTAIVAYVRGFCTGPIGGD